MGPPDLQKNVCIYIYIYICKDSICNDLKLVLGSYAESPNNKFVEHGYKRTRLTSKEKQLNLTFLDGLTQILRSISP